MLHVVDFVVVVVVVAMSLTLNFNIIDLNVTGDQAGEKQSVTMRRTHVNTKKLR
jgi:hypothetical protein